jgi:hypothetical protein
MVAGQFLAVELQASVCCDTVRVPTPQEKTASNPVPRAERERP